MSGKKKDQSKIFPETKIESIFLKGEELFEGRDYIQEGNKMKLISEKAIKLLKGK